MKYILVLSFVFSSAVIFAQNYVPIDTAVISCKYNYYYQKDSLNRASTSGEEMTLLIGNHCSVFLATNELYIDSVLRAFSGKPFNESYVKEITPLVQGIATDAYCNYHIYNNFIRDTIIFRAYLNNKNIIVKESNKVNWKIEANRDTVILGYKCLKASTEIWGRKFIAWFTLEIPLSYGPYKFCGLPGLIVQISDSKKQHSFTINAMKSLKGKQQAIYYLNENYNEISAVDYVKSLQYYFANLYNRVSTGGVVTFQDDDRKARSLDRIRSRNNYIEKY